MKILHVIESYGGGALVSTTQLANAFAAKGEDIILAYGLRPETPVNHSDRLHPKVRHVHVAHFQRGIDSQMDFKAFLELRQLFKNEAPDVIHLHSSKAGFLGRLAALSCGMRDRVLYSPRSYAFKQAYFSKKQRHKYRLLEALATKFAGRVVACSQEEYQDALSLGAKAEHIPNALDFPALDRIVAGVSRHPGPLTIGTLCRISEAKQPELFAEIADRVARRSRVRVQFLWIGGGDNHLLPPQIPRTGWLAREAALRELVGKVDVFLLLSSAEGLSISLIEAQALGLPAVVTSVGGNVDVVEDGVTGYICPNGAISSITEQTLKIVEDDEIRSSMSVAAAARARSLFALPKMVEKYAELYSRIAASSGLKKVEASTTESPPKIEPHL